jgi:hypothetical protein
MAIDDPACNGTMPQPFTPTIIQGPADDSRRDFAKSGSSTPAEALANDPRKHPVTPARK